MTDVEAAPIYNSSSVPTNSDYHKKKVITILALIFAFPLGIIFMWLWMKSWKLEVKGILTGIALLPILYSIPLAIVLMAVNPARQFAVANNTKRKSDVTAISNAIYKYAAENLGQLPPPLQGAQVGTTFSISNTGTGAMFCNALVPTYIPLLPKDPSIGIYTNCNIYNTGYTISISPKGLPIVSAPNAELNMEIVVNR